MKILITLLLTCFTGMFSNAQNIDNVINVKEVERIETVLASDKMQGRKAFTRSIDSAAKFIAGEFERSGLKYFDGLSSYLQPFSILKVTLISASRNMNGQSIDADHIVAITTDADLKFDENSDYTKVVIGDTANFFKESFRLLKDNKKYLVLLDTAHAKNFDRLRRFNRESFEKKAPVVFVLANENPSTYHFEIKNEITSSSLANVVGVLPGKSRKSEYVIFSAHYDHLGMGKPDAKGDSIYNGANDDAAGTTAVIYKGYCHQQ